MTVESQRRRLSKLERRYLKRQRQRLVNKRAALWQRAVLTGGGLFGGLAGLTLLADREHPTIVLGFWSLFGVLIGAWVILPERRKLLRRIAAYDQALANDICREHRIVANRMWEFEEEEDEGACYAIENDKGEVVFISGQDFYPGAKFPNADFSIIEFVGAGGELIDRLIVKRGSKLHAERVISAAEKKAIVVPEHCRIFHGTLEEVYDQLRTASKSHTRPNRP